LRDGATTIAGGTIGPDGSWTTGVNLGDGHHVLTAVATDLAGNASAPSAPVAVDVDTSAPATPTITAPHDGALLGHNDVNATGTSEPNATVTLTVDGTDAHSTTAGSDGTWQIALTLPDGHHTFRVMAVDRAGNASPPSDPIG